MTSPSTRSGFRELLTLVLIVHAPLLVLDGVYWDGWILQGRVAANDYERVAAFYSEVGMPEFAPLHWALSTFSFPFGHRLAALVAAIVISASALGIARKLLPGRDETAWWIAAFLSASPGLWTSMPEVSITTYFLFLAVFAGGSLLVLQGYESKKAPWVLGGHLVLTASFAFQSLVPYSAALGGLLLLFFRQKSGRLERWHWIAAAAPSVCAVIFFGAHRLLAPPHGMYAGYNSPGVSFGAGGFATILIRQLQYVLFSFYDAAIANFLASPIEVLALGLLLVLFLPRGGESPDPAPRILWVGLALVLIGAVPYAAVNKGPNMAIGWEVRHSILATLGLSVLVVGLSERLSQALRRPLRVFLVVVGAAFVFSNYLSLQARHAKDLSLSRALAAANLPAATGVWVHDAFPLWSEQPYITTELAALHRLATNKTDRVLIDAREKGQFDFVGLKKHWQVRYSMESASCPESWVDLTISPGRVRFSQAEIAIRYWTYKFLWKSRMADFLDGLARVEVSEARADPEASRQCREAPTPAPST